MSKSYGNYIGITEAPEEQYGKTMSIPDKLLEEWYDLASLLEGDDLTAAKKRIATDPYASKRELARKIAATYHGDEGARRAEEHFDRLFKQKALPDEMPTFELDLSDPRVKYTRELGAWLPGVLVATNLASSNGEAGRLIEQGAIAVNEERVDDRNAHLRVDGEVVLRRGKRQFARVRFR
jgi:tyrosyl-tRNA synthetase